MWISSGSPISYQVSAISSSLVSSRSVQKSRTSPDMLNCASVTGIVVSSSSAFSIPWTVDYSQRVMAMLSEYMRQASFVSWPPSPETRKILRI